MQFGFRGWMSLIIGALLIVVGLLPKFGISLLPLGGMWMIILLIAALVFLIIDGFGEDHALKTITLITGLLIALYLAIPIANVAGWIGFSIPGAISAFEGYVQGLCGVLLIVGAFKG